MNDKEHLLFQLAESLEPGTNVRIAKYYYENPYFND